MGGWVSSWARGCGRRMWSWWAAGRCARRPPRATSSCTSRRAPVLHPTTPGGGAGGGGDDPRRRGRGGGIEWEGGRPAPAEVAGSDRQREGTWLRFVIHEG